MAKDKERFNNELDKIPEFHSKEVDEGGGVVYTVVCAYCGNEISFKHSEKPSKCPYCGAKDYRKPKTETMLFQLQQEYTTTGDKDVLTKMYAILRDYAKSILKKHLPRDFTYHYSLVEEKANDAANLLIENYLSKPNFYIENSFAGYLQWKVKQVLWNKKTKREEDHESLNVHIENEDSSTPELVDLTSQAENSPTSWESSTVFLNSSTNSRGVEDVVLDPEVLKEDLEKGVIALIERILDTVEVEYSKHMKLLLIGAMCVQFSHNMQDNDAINRYYTRFGTRVKPLLEGVVLMIYRFVKEEWGE